MILKREIVKYVRDAAKNSYVLDKECRICKTKEKLELHHYNTLSRVISKWLETVGYNSEDVLDWRHEFISEHNSEVYKEVVTLCSHHHQKELHRIYGQSPLLITAEKQKNWVELQRSKHEELV